MGLQNRTQRAEQAALPVDECAVAIECYGFEAIEVQGPEILSGKNPAYKSFHQLGDAFGMEQDYLTGRQARNQLYATTDWKLARAPDVFSSGSFYQSASCKVFTCSSRARTYSRSACNSACSFLINPSTR